MGLELAAASLILALLAGTRCTRQGRQSRIGAVNGNPNGLPDMSDVSRQEALVSLRSSESRSSRGGSAATVLVHRRAASFEPYGSACSPPQGLGDSVGCGGLSLRAGSMGDPRRQQAPAVGSTSLAERSVTTVRRVSRQRVGSRRDWGELLVSFR